MKILYAARNNYHSKIQLDRFLEEIDLSKHNLKIAAYKNFFPQKEVNWDLSPCLTVGENKYLFSNNKYLDIYEEQVKSFNPDLIISDLEIYTSFIALKLNKKLWHVSNKLHNFALSQIFKEEINIHKYYKSLYENSNLHKSIAELIDGADNNFVYSHFCDIDEKIILNKKFSWIRPYHYTGKQSLPAHHKIVALDYGNFNLIKHLSSIKDDCVLFSNNQLNYKDIICKNYCDKEEYKLNISNCDIVVCHGESTSLADAFYNKRKIKILPDQTCRENMFNYLIYHKIYNYMIEDDVIIPIDPSIDSNINLLHEKVEKNL
jgi:hypothetical protein